MPVTYTFANATAAIPLSQLDNNFATPITIGNVAIQLGNTVSSIGNVTLANATVSNSTLGNVTITSVASTFPNNYLSNSSVTIGNTAVALGSSASTIGNVTLTNATLSSLATPITTAEGGTGLSGSTPFTANGVVYASSTSALATGSGLVFDGSNLGLGVTPPTQNGGTGMWVTKGSVITDGNSFYPGIHNAYYNSGWKYTTTGYAQFYIQDDTGKHIWYNAPSGTAGNTISFTQAMTLDNSGNLLIGNTSGSGRLYVESTSAPHGVFRNPYGASYTSLRLYNDTNSSGRSLEIDYFGSTASGGERAEITTTGSYPLAFLTSNVERARITSGGAFIVGGTTAANSAVITATNGGGVMGMSAYNGNNNGTINTIVSGNGSGGGLIIVSGVSFSSGQSFSRLYLAGVKVAGGTTSVFTTAISSVGEAGASFTFADSGGYVTATASGLPNASWTVMWINT
jgi:hypothetical protein